MKNKSILTMFLILGILTGCDNKNHYQKKTTQTVKVYKQHKHDLTNNDDFIFWYIIYYNNQYYYYSSQTYIPVTSYSTVDWQSSRVSPIEETKVETTETVEENVVPIQDLGQQMETVIDTTEQQISDMISEGNPNMQDGSTDSVSESSDSGADSGGSSD